MCTDYPDGDLIRNLEVNFSRNLPADGDYRYQVKGFLWGSEVQTDLDPEPFDLVILSDLLFNHSEHRKLAASLKASLAADGIAVCSFTHHRPWLAQKDLHFFEVAREFGLESELTHSEIMSPAFLTDRGDETVRSTIHFYLMKHQQ
jgi:nicotinamide N-methyltransferase